MNETGAPAQSARSSSIVSRVLGALVGAVALVFALLFSVALFAVLAVAGLGIFGYLWWKTRALRRALREERERFGEQRERFGETRERPGGRIIEAGEIVEVQEARLEDRSNTGR